MPVNGPGAARRGAGSGSEGPSAREAPSGPQIGPFCTCGHERPEHRHGRCWVGWDGQPVYRTRSAIACPCIGWEPTP